MSGQVGQGTWEVSGVWAGGPGHLGGWTEGLLASHFLRLDRAMPHTAHRMLQVLVGPESSGVGGGHMRANQKRQAGLGPHPGARV